MGRPERDGAGQLLKTCDIPSPSVWDRSGPTLHVALLLGSWLFLCHSLPPWPRRLAQLSAARRAEERRVAMSVLGRAGDLVFEDWVA